MAIKVKRDRGDKRSEAPKAILFEDKKTDHIFDFEGEDISEPGQTSKYSEDIRDNGSSDDQEQSELFQQLIGDFQPLKLEESKQGGVNPEVDCFRDYLISSLVKLCKYDKGTVLQLFQNPN